MVGHDEQAVPLDVVAGIDDDRELAGLEGQLQAMGELRPARAAGEDDDLHGRNRSWTSAMRWIVSVS